MPFKGCLWFFLDLGFFCKKNPNRARFHFEIFSRLLMIKQWFLVQNDTEDWIFKMQKFFTPLKSFLPHFFYPRWSFCQKKKSKSSFFKLASTEKVGGKKLLRGVKNFWVLKNSFSALFCTVNHCYSSKTRDFMSKWK